MKTNGVLAFCGSKGSGKSTSYELFKNFYNGEIEEIALAGHLKEVCSKVFGIDMAHFVDPTKKEVEFDEYIVLKTAPIEEVYRLFNITNYNFDKHVRPHGGQVIETPRKLLQYIGTEVLHPIDPLIHVKTAMAKKNDTKLTIITDLRFKAEFEYFQENLKDQFTAVYIKRSSAELLAENDSHPSERELLLFKNKCYLIENELTVNDLESKLSAFVDDLFKETKNDGLNLETGGSSKASLEESTQVSSN